jgi:hypothetical protein
LIISTAFLEDIPPVAGFLCIPFPSTRAFPPILIDSHRIGFGMILVFISISQDAPACRNARRGIVSYRLFGDFDAKISGIPAPG